MIAYATLGSNDLLKATEFYDAILGEVGIGQMWSTEGFVGYGLAMDKPMLGICKPHDGQAASVGNGTMIALALQAPEQVHKVHAKALALGGKDEGAPGPRGETGFYCGYFRDPDGNKLNAFCMVPPATD